MKKSELIFIVLRIPLDYALLVLSGITAFFARNSIVIQEWRPITFDLSLSHYIIIIFVASAFCVFIFALLGLYGVEQRFNSGPKDLSQVSFGMTICSMALFTGLFLTAKPFSSRFLVITSWIFAIFFVTAGRFTLRKIQNWMTAKYNIGVHRILAIGVNGNGKEVLESIQDNRELGYKIIKVLKDFSIHDLEKIYQHQGFDEIIQCDPEINKERSLEAVEFCNQKRIAFKYIPNLFQTLASNTNIYTLNGIPIIEIRRTPLDGWGQIAKRSFDIAGSLALIIFTSPIMLITAVAIKLDSSGHVLYLDYRYGKNFQKFIFYKFRSMQANLCDGEGPSATKEGNQLLEKLSDSEANTRKGPLHKIENDPRITRVGKIIRRFSIDEFPEFFNVLKGDLSLIGPRPHMTLEVQKYKDRHKKVFEIKPGITGIAQTSGRSDLDFEKEVRLDTYYMENWSFWGDVRILLKTPFAVLRRRKVE
ncbi:sugar transferase [bacterium]|nr:MAG: sugar transferase [bacterium]